MATTVIFTEGRNNSLLTRWEGKIAFPDKRGPQPQAGDEWEVLSASPHPSGSVYFLTLGRRIPRIACHPVCCYSATIISMSPEVVRLDAPTVHFKSSDRRDAVQQYVGGYYPLEDRPNGFDFILSIGDILEVEFMESVHEDGQKELHAIASSPIESAYPGHKEMAEIVYRIVEHTQASAIYQEILTEVDALHPLLKSDIIAYVEKRKAAYNAANPYPVIPEDNSPHNTWDWTPDRGWDMW